MQNNQLNVTFDVDIQVEYLADYNIKRTTQNNMELMKSNMM